MYLAYYDKASDYDISDIKLRLASRKRVAWADIYDLKLKISFALDFFKSRKWTCGYGIPTFIYTDKHENGIDVYKIELQQTSSGISVFAKLNGKECLNFRHKIYQNLNNITLANIIAQINDIDEKELFENFYENSEGIGRDSDAVFAKHNSQLSND